MREYGREVGAAGIRDFETIRIVSLQKGGISWKSTKMGMPMAAMVRQKSILREFEATLARKPLRPSPVPNKATNTQK